MDGLNIYAFVRGNPVTHVDDDGTVTNTQGYLLSVFIGLLLGAAIGAAIGFAIGSILGGAQLGETLAAVGAGLGAVGGIAYGKNRRQ